MAAKVRSLTGYNGHLPERDFFFVPPLLLHGTLGFAVSRKRPINSVGILGQAFGIDGKF